MKVATAVTIALTLWRVVLPAYLLPAEGRYCSMVKVPPLAVPQLAPCVSLGRAWRLRAARYSQSEAQPLGAPPPSRGLERAASKVAGLTAF